MTRTTFPRGVRIPRPGRVSALLLQPSVLAGRQYPASRPIAYTSNRRHALNRTKLPTVICEAGESAGRQRRIAEFGRFHYQTTMAISVHRLTNSVL